MQLQQLCTQAASSPQHAAPWQVVSGVCAIAMLLCSMHRNTFTMLLPLMAEGCSFTLQQQGNLHAAMLVGYLAGQLPAGQLADRFGGDRVLMVGLLLWSLATAATGLASSVPASMSFAVAAAARLSMGFFSAAAMPAVSAMASRWVPQSSKASTIAVIYACFNLGSVFGAMVMPLLAERFLWQGTFAVSALGGVMWALGGLATIAHAAKAVTHASTKPLHPPATPSHHTPSPVLSHATPSPGSNEPRSHSTHASGPSLAAVGVSQPPAQVGAAAVQHSTAAAAAAAAAAAVSQAAASHEPPVASTSAQGSGTAVPASPASPPTVPPPPPPPSTSLQHPHGTSSPGDSAPTQRGGGSNSPFSDHGDAGDTRSGRNGVGSGSSRRSSSSSSSSSSSTASGASGPGSEAGRAPTQDGVATEGVAGAPAVPFDRQDAAVQFVVLCWAHACIGWSFFVMSAYLPQYLTFLGIGSLASTGFLTGLPFLAAAAVGAVAGGFADKMLAANTPRLQVRRMMHAVATLGYALVLAPLLVPGFTPTPALATGCLIAGFSANAFSFGGFHAYVQDIIEPQSAGMMLGLTNSCSIVMGIAGTVATPMIVAASGSYQSVFLITAALHISSFIAFTALLRGRPLLLRQLLAGSAT
ncbi:MAG: hypothetical protein WDW36_002766 [Sanguina aurantia]